MRLLAERGVPLRPARRGHGALRRRARRRRRAARTQSAHARSSRSTPANRRAVVEPGVVNATLTRAAAPYGLHYAPDPSSQAACTIGGNVAENAGGPHCLKYGVTLNHVRRRHRAAARRRDRHARQRRRRDGRLRPARRVRRAPRGASASRSTSPCGSTPNPQAVRTLLADFTSIDAAARATSAIIASGIVPAALEMMDSADDPAVEASIYAAGYPDGRRGGPADRARRPRGRPRRRTRRACRGICTRAPARATCASPPTTRERARLWQGRKKAFGAMGRIAPHLVVQDAVVPRTRLPEVLATHRARSAQRHGVHGLQRVPRRRRQPAPEHRLRRERPGRVARACTRRCARSCRRASPPAARSPASTASGSTSSTTWTLLFSPRLAGGDVPPARGVRSRAPRESRARSCRCTSCREWHGAPGRRGAALTARDARDARDRSPTRIGAPRDDRSATRDRARRDARRALRIVGARHVARRRPAGRTPTRTLALAALARHRRVRARRPHAHRARRHARSAEIAAATAAHGQWLALDPFGDDDGTFGATVATASCGPAGRRVRHAARHRARAASS